MKTLGLSSKQNSALVAFVLHLLTVHLIAGAPQFRWAQSAGGEGRDYPTGVSVDSAGNSYVTGGFTSSNALFGNFTLTNGGLFVAKYGTNGNVLWARQISPSFPPPWYGIAAGQSGDCYVGGTFADTITFGDLTLTNGNGSTNPSPYEMFLARYDDTGNLAWARRAGSNGVTNLLRGLALAVDGMDYCYLAGDYYAADFGVTNLVATNTINFFTARFDTNGNLVWICDTPASENLFGLAVTKSIRLLPSGGYIIGGQFETTFTLGNFVLTNAGSDFGTDLFLARSDASGSLLWAKRGGSTNYDYWRGIEVDASGNSYVAGIITSFLGSTPASFDECVVSNQSQLVSFLVKYGSDGSVLWCKESAEFTNSPVNYDVVERLAADAAGNLYLCGTFGGVVNFTGITLTNAGGNGFDFGTYASHFVAKLDSDGRALWAKRFGGAKRDDHLDIVFSLQRETGIAVDAGGNCSIAGFMSKTNAIFDTFTLAPAGDFDVFVARLDADPPRLDISFTGNSVVLFWLTNQPNFVLESSTNLLLSDGWLSLTDSVATAGIRHFVTNPISTDNRYFRLHRH